MTKFDYAAAIFCISVTQRTPSCNVLSLTRFHSILPVAVCHNDSVLSAWQIWAKSKTIHCHGHFESHALTFLITHPGSSFNEFFYYLVLYEHRVQILKRISPFLRLCISLFLCWSWWTVACRPNAIRARPKHQYIIRGAGCSLKISVLIFYLDSACLDWETNSLSASLKELISFKQKEFLYSDAAFTSDFMCSICDMWQWQKLCLKIQ